MSSEPIAMTTTTDASPESAERGLLVAMLLLVLMGVAGMLFMI